MRTTGLLVAAVGLAAVAVSSLLARPAAADPPPPAPEITQSPAPTGPFRADSAVWVFAAVEDAWMAGDTDRLAALVDTATVRVALKPGTPPTSAMTRSAVAFLFRDQLRLVNTTSFQIVRLEVKKGRAQALALWSGDWGGRQGSREVEVGLVAVLHGNRWELSEVRAND